MSKRRSERSDVLEAEWTRTVVETAQRLGWLAAHHPDSRLLVGDRGAPDIEAVHPARGRHIRIELKRRGRKVDAGQLRWHAALETCGVEVYVIMVPDELDALEAILRA